MRELLNILFKNSKELAAIITIISVLIEITPIRLNPISYLLKKIGNMMNADINHRLNKLEEYVIENHKKELRIQISNFASDLRHNVPKSESQFIAIIQLCDEYLENKWNSKVKLDAEFIKKEYLKIGEKIKKEEIKI